jgi:hypothetical protein
VGVRGEAHLALTNLPDRDGRQVRAGKRDVCGETVSEKDFGVSCPAGRSRLPVLRLDRASRADEGGGGLSGLAEARVETRHRLDDA